MNKNPDFGFKWSDFYDENRLDELDAKFLVWLQEKDTALCKSLLSARNNPHNDPLATSRLIMDLAPLLELFISILFGIEDQIEKLQSQENELDILSLCKRDFVQRRVQLRTTPEDANSINIDEITKALEPYLGQKFDALIFSKKVMEWLKNPDSHKLALNLAYAFTTWQIYKGPHDKPWLFQIPETIDYDNLVHFPKTDEMTKRDGFDLTDPGITKDKAHLESKYCLGCHERGKDSCSKGIIKDGEVSRNPLGIELSGCPLGQKISEMNVLRSQGFVLGSLATAMIDNPMIAGTGHRICNDCEKACIFQKQTPVEIPAIETETFEQILHLPYGFEIISLLSRWNPLNITNPLPLPDSGYKVLVIGMGPAGYTAAHYLMNLGHHVVGIDGLKIEPMPSEFLDISKPIKDYKKLEENLSLRKSWGFGGVAEYGITSRWNKNYLKVIRLMLERRARFKLYGGIRLGSNITIKQALDLRFDHIVLALGAGDPNVINIENMLSPGVKMASDFLMALNLGMPYKPDSRTNLTIRMPIAVIGGGLTAIDAATEVLAYYPEQIKKFKTKIDELKQQKKYETFRKSLSVQDMEILDEFLYHARLFAENPESKHMVLQRLGGAKILYRKRLQDAPAYKLNHKEINAALQEGVEFISNKEPQKIELDANGYASHIKTKDGELIPAKTIIIAAGTNPNTTIADEDEGVGFPFMRHPENLTTTRHPEPTPMRHPELVSGSNLNQHDTHSVILTYNNTRKLSYLGDMHPQYAGSVVKAMASAKYGTPEIDAEIRKTPPASIQNLNYILDQELLAEVVSVERLTPKVIEVKVKSPQAASNFRPGQFFKLQNYESAMPSFEPLALTGAHVDGDIISLIVLELGESSLQCQYLTPGEKVSLMGPTGSPSEIGHSENVLLIGGGLGNAVLFSIAEAMKKSSCHITYIAGYKTTDDIFKRDFIEDASDRLIWCIENSDREDVIHGNVIDGMRSIKDKLKEFDRILVIGSDAMMASVKQSLCDEFKTYLNPKTLLIASINSPMQCMMKGVCAQCLQRQETPDGPRFVYSCRNQDQPITIVDFKNLQARLSQNSLWEKVTSTIPGPVDQARHPQKA